MREFLRTSHFTFYILWLAYFRMTNVDISVRLPQEVLSHIISFTTPADAIRSSVCCHAFQSAADSDAVWHGFLPSDYREIVPAELTSLPKKQLYLGLCDHPILINDGTMSFGLEKQSGQKCYMIGARGLSICWGDMPNYWEWNSLPQTESRFAEVAQLRRVWWLDVRGRIETRMLSPNTAYTVYFVYKIAGNGGGGISDVFRTRPVQLRVSFEGIGEQDEDGEQTRSVILEPTQDLQELPLVRGDGWKEVEMGEFFNADGDDGVVACRLREVDNHCVKEGLIVQGIEFRPR